ncbi:signal peptidase I [Streptomyces tsukubensis]|uniref:Signal peptidase I n=1 Tax=Streptomyces tsukubensis (strain DSM 42081 / NBRC 108919 / NRRL 18488 / 9993) TaxID=1114943 RepID=A0A7G3UPF5_STRT9|nr:signal peptidase I [Streptomyces tsukubensis]QKM71471.1 signal peptidase I [Streptomyces tsukubensis NRRL18488]TAI42177.1 signal peptidase I [Streptomyces tsukubensis]
MAVGARSGHEQPEDRPEGPDGPPGAPGAAGSPAASASAAPPVATSSVAASLKSGDGEQAAGGAGGPGGPLGPGAPRDGGSGGSGGGASVPPSSDGSSSGGSSGTGEGEDDEDETRPRAQRSFWKELPILIGIALVLALLIKTFLVQAFSIPSDSMQNTLQRGDRVLVDKLTPWFGSEPERGEVVVFHDPGGWLEGEPTPEPNVMQKFLSFIGLMPSAEEKDLIKRTIAIGGDTVECKKGGPVKVNGVALDEPYIFPGDTPCDDQPFGPLTVPKDKIWVMGDHRSNSRDSRYHTEDVNGGFVPVDKVVGRAVVIAWPLNRWATLPIPSTYDQKGINEHAAALISSSAPAAMGALGAVPLVLWRRRRLIARETAAQITAGRTPEAP